MSLEVLSRFLSCGIWALQEAVYDCLLNWPMQRKTPMQFLFSSESKANLRAVILMAAGINELNLNTHLYLLQLFKYGKLVICSRKGELSWTEVLYSDSGDCIFLCNDMYQAIFSDRASRLSSAPGY
jgi:hypothetical protein